MQTVDAQEGSYQHDLDITRHLRNGAGNLVLLAQHRFDRVGVKYHCARLGAADRPPVRSYHIPRLESGAAGGWLHQCPLH